MSSNDLLSQDEIDALLHGVDLGELEPESGIRSSAGTVPLYDFFSQDRVVPGRMMALDTINERFARGLRVSMSEFFCSAVEIAVGGVQILKFAEFRQDLHVPTSLNLVAFKPLPGTALLTLDPALVFRTVESLFGGDGQCPPSIEATEFTPVEERVIQQMLEQIFEHQRQAWAPILDLEPEWLGAESGPVFDNVFDAAEAMVVADFDLRFPGGNGELRIAIPYAMLEPILDRLGTSITDQRGQDDHGWQSAMRERLDEADMQVSTFLVKTTITLQQLAKFQVGDVIPVEMSRPVHLCAEQIPIYWGEFGVHEGHYAFKIGGSCSTQPVIDGGSTRRRP